MSSLLQSIVWASDLNQSTSILILSEPVVGAGRPLAEVRVCMSRSSLMWNNAPASKTVLWGVHPTGGFRKSHVCIVDDEGQFEN